LTAVPQAQALPEAPDSVSVRKEALPALLEFAVPCIPLGARPEEHPREHVPDSASVPAPVGVRALAHVPVPEEVPDLYRLPAICLARSAQVQMRVVAASNIPRPKKAR
jgi:hypothetical protein